MSKSKKKTISIFGGIVALLAIIAMAMIYFIDASSYKSRLQSVASEVLGMEVVINGRIGIGFYPGVRLRVHDVSVSNHGKQLVSVGKVRVGLDLLSLLRGEVRIKNISLIRPVITVEHGADGEYSFERIGTTGAVKPGMILAKISLSDGRVLYADKRSGGMVAAEDCNLNLRNLLMAGRAMDVMRDISFAADLYCGRVRANSYTMSDVKLSVSAENGILDFKQIRLKIFGGDGSGDMRVDYSGAIPRYRFTFALPRFRIEELINTQSPQRILEGPMSFSMDLSLQGKAAQQMKQSASGNVLLQGKDLRLHGHNLDLELDRYESSQNFSLLDMGAFFVAGPIGMAVTKGHDFANVLAGSGGVSAIRTFVSRWKVRRGVMYAQDVAMATNRHRMAFLGGLDIAHSRFIDVTMALINSQGCAEVQQQISGPFERPVVQKPNILKSVAGPVLKLFKEGRKLLPGGGCKVIYAGEVAAPR